ncbi:hypothetical protein V3W47_18910 [Deinococcus sp. YIM 134068]|uniref:hypothetical protein n=1 Tax=Deinococcus lichenicola TaxID=3118910 RepID=UPI002F95D073
MHELPLTLTPAQVGERLEVSPAGLRRLAVTYEEVHGPLPRPPGSPSRLWPLPAVEAVEMARVMVAEGEAPSIRRALELLKGEEAGAPLAPLTLSVSDVGGADLTQLRDVVAALALQVHRLSEERAAHVEELAELRALVAQEGRLTRDAVRAALTAQSAAQLAPRAVGWWRRLLSLGTSSK